MAYAKDITGMVFGRLTAKMVVGKYRRGNVWGCVCECGNYVHVRLCNLKTGNTKTCGKCKNE